MKRIYVFLLFFFICVHVIQAQIKAHVDERFELTSITFALAGVPEFCDSRVPSYSQDIMTYFAPYEFTEPINYVRELHQKHNIGFDAISNIATLLEIKKGKIILKKNIPNVSEIDSRWNENLFTNYIKMLNLFYKKSNFKKFYNDHREIYEVAEQQMNRYLTDFNLNNWLYSFYGKNYDQTLNIYISLVNGPHNYAFTGGVIIGMDSDKNGSPAPNLQTFPILIHEILHHYSNPIFDSFWKDMKGFANKIYPFVEEQMKNIAYGNPQAMTLEWLNRLFVLMYLKEINYKTLEFEITQNMQKGFKWMQRSLNFMDNFYANRERYRFIEDFMPQLVSFLGFTANNFESILKEYEHNKPIITNVFPAPGSSLKGFDKIIITFSQPMNGSFGFSGVPPNCKPLPVDFNDIKWSSDKYDFIMKLEHRTEENNLKYGAKLNPTSFQSYKYYKLNENVDLNLEFLP